MMKITRVEKPKFCRRCGRHINEALKEQRDAKMHCDDEQCTFREEITQALANNHQSVLKMTVLEQPRFTIVESHKKFKIK